MVDVDQAGESERSRLVNYLTAHVFRPARRDGATAGALVAGAALLLGLLTLARSLFRPISFAAFGGEVTGVVLIAVGSLLAYWAYAFYELRYIVDDHSLVIAWGLTRVAIPVAQIHRIVLGRRFAHPRVSGVSWPGCHAGRGRIPRFGQVLFYSTHRSPADLVYVSTSESTFGLSLADARGLARAIQTAQETNSQEGGAPLASYRVLPGEDFIRDGRAVLLAVCALLAFLLAAGYIYTRFQALPLSLALDYPPTDGPQRVGQRGELLRVPLTALLWLLAGFVTAIWAHARFRAVSYALLAGTLFAECLYLVASIAAAH